jgi:hypothetical protein
MTLFRTDTHNNPTAFTTDIAKEAGLKLNVDYTVGDAFQAGAHQVLYTARLLGDPIETTIRVIDKVGFYTVPPHMRWGYIAIPWQIWLSFNSVQKVYVIGFMYGQEGGEKMKPLFVNLNLGL